MSFAPLALSIPQPLGVYRLGLGHPDTLSNCNGSHFRGIVIPNDRRPALMFYRPASFSSGFTVTLVNSDLAELDITQTPNGITILNRGAEDLVVVDNLLLDFTYTGRVHLVITDTFSGTTWKTDWYNMMPQPWRCNTHIRYRNCCGLNGIPYDHADLTSFFWDFYLKTPLGEPKFGGTETYKDNGREQVLLKSTQWKRQLLQELVWDSLATCFQFIALHDEVYILGEETVGWNGSNPAAGDRVKEMEMDAKWEEGGCLANLTFYFKRVRDLITGCCDESSIASCYPRPGDARLVGPRLSPCLQGLDRFLFIQAGDVDGVTFPMVVDGYPYLTFFVEGTAGPVTPLTDHVGQFAVWVEDPGAWMFIDPSLDVCDSGDLILITPVIPLGGMDLEYWAFTPPMGLQLWNQPSLDFLSNSFADVIHVQIPYSYNRFARVWACNTVDGTYTLCYEGTEAALLTEHVLSFPGLSPAGCWVYIEYFRFGCPSYTSVPQFMDGVEADPGGG